MAKRESGFGQLLFSPFFLPLYFLFGVFRLGEAAAGWERRQRPI
jgi:hypothetical protein